MQQRAENSENKDHQRLSKFSSKSDAGKVLDKQHCSDQSCGSDYRVDESIRKTT